MTKTNWPAILLLIALFFLWGAFSPSGYEANLIPVNGYDIHLATRPNKFGGVKKSFDVMLELGPRCTYEILGWDEENTLYYNRFYKDKVSSFAYSPPDVRSKAVNDIPDNLAYEKYNDGGLLQKLRVNGYFPHGDEASTRALYFEGNSAVQSPDGQHIAFIQQALYSEYDVTVISPIEP